MLGKRDEIYNIQTMPVGENRSLAVAVAVAVAVAIAAVDVRLLFFMMCLTFVFIGTEHEFYVRNHTQQRVYTISNSRGWRLAVPVVP